MAWLIIIGTFAAWGAFCLLWVLLGWLLPGEDGYLLLCPGASHRHTDGVLLRYRWLRGLGLLSGPLLLPESAYSPAEQAILQRKHPGIEFYSLDALQARLELEREKLD